MADGVDHLDAALHVLHELDQKILALLPHAQTIRASAALSPVFGALHAGRRATSNSGARRVHRVASKGAHSF